MHRPIDDAIGKRRVHVQQVDRDIRLERASISNVIHAELRVRRVQHEAEAVVADLNVAVEGEHRVGVIEDVLEARVDVGLLACDRDLAVEARHPEVRRHRHFPTVVVGVDGVRGARNQKQSGADERSDACPPRKRSRQSDIGESSEASKDALGSAGFIGRSSQMGVLWREPYSSRRPLTNGRDCQCLRPVRPWPHNGHSRLRSDGHRAVRRRASATAPRARAGLKPPDGRTLTLRLRILVLDRTQSPYFSPTSSPPARFEQAGW